MESRTFSTRACIGQCVRKYSDYVIRVCNIETSNLEPQEEQRLRMLLLSSGFAAVISFLMGSISYNIDTAFRPTHTVMFGASVIYLFIPILFRLTKDVFIGLMVFAALSWAVVFLIAFYAYGLPSPVLSGFFVLTIIGFIIGSKKVGWFSVLLSILGIAILYFLHQSNYSFRNFAENRIISIQFFNEIFMLCMTGVLLWFYEHSREQSAQLVDQTMKELELARDEAELASQSKTQFLAKMSHVLRTPLSAILGYAELVREELEELPANNQARGLEKDMGRIEHSAHHLLELINELLDLSKIEAREIVIMPERIQVDTFLRDLQFSIVPMLEIHQNDFELTLPEDLGDIIVDPFRLKQILLNLLSNACKFTDQGLIKLSVARQGDCVCFYVEDSGIGMIEEQLIRVFEPFKQADDSIQHKYGGTGLGLSIAQELAMLMNGQITATSEAGKGSIFTLDLPQTPPKKV